MAADTGRTCPRCGSRFGCEVAQPRCWCHEIMLSAAALADLRERYEACLCPDCLRLWAAGASPPADETTATKSGRPPVVAVVRSRTGQA